MNAVASGLIEAIKYALGADPYTYPPVSTDTDWDVVPTGATSWYKYGGGGVSSFGSLCGVPNAACAVCNLMGVMGFNEQIMLYACQTEFPCRGLRDLQLDPTYGWDESFAPIPMADNEVLAYTVADSPLCHASVSKWAEAAGVLFTDTTPYATAHKTDRCAKVCADVAAFTAGLLNGIASELELPAATAQCMSCHNTSATSVFPAQQGKMDCSYCHGKDTVLVSNQHPGKGKH